MLVSIAGSKGDEIRFSTAVQPNPCGKVTTKHRSEQVLKFSLLVEMSCRPLLQIKSNFHHIQTDDALLPASEKEWRSG